MADANGRDGKGRFAPGNPGGPGRPRRPVEREYLIAVSEACPLAAWREIVAAAVRLAKGGDDKSRAWLSQFLVGKEPPSLHSVAVDEALGADPVALDAADQAELHGLNTAKGEAGQCPGT